MGIQPAGRDDAAEVGGIEPHAFRRAPFSKRAWTAKSRSTPMVPETRFERALCPF